MDLSMYIGKKVRIDLNIKTYYYIGICLKADNDSITIKDKNGNLVSLAKSSIIFIREEK